MTRSVPNDQPPPSTSPWLLNEEDLEDYTPDEHAYVRDVKIDEAKDVIMKHLFDPDPKAVFYERQLEVILEKQFFHWITAKALRELTEERRIQSEKVPLGETTEMRFYMSKGHRNWRLQAREIKGLVLRFSTPEFGRALGRHGEMMFDAALPRFGFTPYPKKNITEYNGKTWPDSKHNLDRVFFRNGIAYGTEIKNKLDYIEHEELEIKLAMCNFLHLRPLFIMRIAPKSYIYEIYQEGGYTLTYDYQLYPHGYLDFAKEVSDRLHLPVDAPSAISDSTIQRFLNWHRKSLGLSDKE